MSLPAPQMAQRTLRWSAMARQWSFEDVRFNSYTLDGQQQSGLDFIVYGLPLSPVAVLKEAAAWTMSYARLSCAELCRPCHRAASR